MKPNGDTVTDPPEVLFVCVHNAGRSQMAAALLQHHAQGRVTVRSAGSAPAASINPAVHEVMLELDSGRHLHVVDHSRVLGGECCEEEEPRLRRIRQRTGRRGVC